MKVNKNVVISAVVTLILGIGISAILFKPMGTVATEKNNTELYLQMKDQATAEVKAEFEEQLAKVKEETQLEIDKLKVEYDKAIADSKLEQAESLQTAIQETQKKIEDSTSWQAIEEKRQEEIKKNPVVEKPNTEQSKPNQSDPDTSGFN